MVEIRLKKGKPTVVQHNAWVRTTDGNWKCGNILIRCDERTPFGGYTFERWAVYITKKNGKIVRIYPASRPWFYGSAGQAKIGVSRMKPIEDSSSPAVSPT